MRFQTLDDKNECVAVYLSNDKELKFSNVPDDVTSTWNYAPYLKGKDIQYAQLYCEGKKLDEVCPEHIKTDLNNINKRLKALVRSFIEAKVSLSDNCFFELVPQRFLKEYCNIKDQVTDHVFQTYSKPINYEFLKQMSEMLTDIKYRKLNIDLELLKQEICNEETQKVYQKYSSTTPYIDYDLFGAITGRLSAKGFPILNFNKKHRHVLSPTNDFFIEIDFNAAEIRMAYALCGNKQPDGDVYEILNNEYYNGELTRAEAKKKAIVWLYDEEQKDMRLEAVFNKKYLLDNHYNVDEVTTAYGRVIKVDERKAIPYLLQSSFIDLFHRQVLKVHKFLEHRNTFIPFMIHDCLYLDMCASEKHLIKDIVDVFSNTQYGKFNVKVKAGKKLSDMKELNLNG